VKFVFPDKPREALRSSSDGRGVSFARCDGQATASAVVPRGVLTDTNYTNPSTNFTNSIAFQFVQFVFSYS